MAISCTRIPCWIPKATDTHSQYVTLTAFPLQQWLNEHTSILRYTYIGCRVPYNVCSQYLSHNIEKIPLLFRSACLLLSPTVRMEQLDI